MRKAYSNQLRLDSVPIPNVELNLQCRDRLVPVLRGLQQLYSSSELTDQILEMIAADVNEDSRTDTGRKGMDYWHICVLAAVRLGCDYTYDQLQNFSENHRNLRAIMGLGCLDDTAFHHKTLRNTFCLLRPATIERFDRRRRKVHRAGGSTQPGSGTAENCAEGFQTPNPFLPHFIHRPSGSLGHPRVSRIDACLPSLAHSSAGRIRLIVS